MKTVDLVLDRVAGMAAVKHDKIRLTARFQAVTLKPEGPCSVHRDHVEDLFDPSRIGKAARVSHGPRPLERIFPAERVVEVVDVVLADPPYLLDGAPTVAHP